MKEDHRDFSVSIVIPTFYRIDTLPKTIKSIKNQKIKPKEVIVIDNNKKKLSKNLINQAFENASKKKLNGILEVTNEKLVSIDFNHNQASSIVDGSLTNVIGNNMGKISSWYDNEWGFSNRMCDIAIYLHKNFG